MLQWSRRLASCYVSTFPSAPPRTGRAPFGAPGSPVSSAIVDDPQDGFGASHLAYLPARVSGHLPPFPVWTAFPPSEYYGGSVARRLAARRAIPHSRGAGRVERDGGASFAPLNGMMSHRPPGGRFERRRHCRPIAVAPPSDAVSRDVRLHRWRLRFEQSGPHRIARALRDGIVSVFGPLPLRRHATVPFDFRRRVSRWPRGHVFQTSPFCERDPAPGDVAHVVGIGDDVRTESLAPSRQTPMLQEPVHVDDGEQRTDDTALRRAARGVLAPAHAPFPFAVPLLDRRSQP